MSTTNEDKNKEEIPKRKARNETPEVPDLTVEDVYALQVRQSQHILSVQRRLDQTRVFGVVLAYVLCILFAVIVGAAIAKHEREAHFHAHCART